MTLSDDALASLLDVLRELSSATRESTSLAHRNAEVLERLRRTLDGLRIDLVTLAGATEESIAVARRVESLLDERGNGAGPHA